jgi:hypothetical protein
MKVALALLVLAAPAWAQTKKHDKDPHKCAVCRAALERAASYALTNYRSSGVAGHAFTGLMLLVMGDRGREFQACVACCSRACTSTYNWDLCLSLYFLSEVAVRAPTAEVQNALVAGLNTAARTREPTGGWGHALGYSDKNGYAKSGGSRDLGVVTSMIYGAMWNMKAAKIGVPKELFESVEKHLNTIFDGGGFSYGTDCNGWRDDGMGRSAYTFLGLANAGETQHPFYDKMLQALGQRFKNIEGGHAFAPIHHFGTAAAMHRAGRYQEFADEWIDKLITKQKADGSVDLVTDWGKRGKFPWENATANAAAFASILLLQKEGAFAPKAKSVETGKNLRSAKSEVPR